jgi:hypothetical protein
MLYHIQLSRDANEIAAVVCPARTHDDVPRTALLLLLKHQ